MRESIGAVFAARRAILPAVAATAVITMVNASGADQAPGSTPVCRPQGSLVTVPELPEASGLAVGRVVNLERPMRLDGRLDGHLVLGHVDGTGRIEQIRAEADAHWVTTSFPAAFSPYFIHKGSVAVDGVSLTVAALREGQFDVQIVPYTWEHTTFGTLAIGDIVNLECDMIGKYVVRVMEIAGQSPARKSDGN